ncbi:MAG: hypothetical protein GXP55_20750 [Deltaproteobacteria bacterium]|nr:hypothetical protein [Deltaproteobacteria bacterium]
MPDELATTACCRVSSRAVEKKKKSKAVSGLIGCTVLALATVGICVALATFVDLTPEPRTTIRGSYDCPGHAVELIDWSTNINWLEGVWHHDLLVRVDGSIRLDTRLGKFPSHLVDTLMPRHTLVGDPDAFMLQVYLDPAVIDGDAASAIASCLEEKRQALLNDAVDDAWGREQVAGNSEPSITLWYAPKGAEEPRFVHGSSSLLLRQDGLLWHQHEHGGGVVGDVVHTQAGDQLRCCRGGTREVENIRDYRDAEGADLTTYYGPAEAFVDPFRR